MNHRLPTLGCLTGLSLLSACADHSSDNVPGSVVSLEPKFETRIELATGTTDHSDAELADFDNDGDLDLVVIGLDGDIQVMLGAGNATFARGQTITVGGEPIAMCAADFDSDQDLDIVVLRVLDQVVDVYLNSGSADFTAGASLAVGAAAVGVLAEDYDADGASDIIVSRITSPEILLFQGDGAGAFTPANSLVMPGGGSPFQMGFGDITHDGDGDLLVCDQTNDRVLVYPGTGTAAGLGATPESIPVAGSPRAVSVGDLSGDGLPDMAVSAYDAGQIVVVTSFNGPVIQGFTVDVAGTPTISTIDDVTGDGLGDLIACVKQRAAITIFPQAAGGGLTGEVQMDATGLPLRPMVGDVNSDQRADLVLLAGLGDRLSLYLGREGGGLIGSHTYDSGLPAPEFLSGGDFDGDGVEDLVVGGFDSTEVSIMVPAPRAIGTGLDLVQMVDVGRMVHNVHAADLDGDGRIDIVVPVQGGVKILRNVVSQSSARFAFEVLPPDPNQTFATGDGPFGVEVADMNGDGRLDLVTADYRDSQVSILLATVQAFDYQLAAAPTVLTGRPVDVALADFNGDGILDVAVSRIEAAVITLLLNDGTGRITPSVDLPVQEAPNYLITEDFNFDGRADLVVSNGASASVSVVFSEVQGFATVNFPAGQTPTALLGRDLTDDGIPDILVASLVGADFRVLVGDGEGGFPAVFTFPGTLGASSAQLQDVDGDTRPDLLLSSLITTRVSMYRNTTQ